MAKKTSTIRVFELARELGVTSKDILAKCKAEGIPAITNHMSTISLGLAATVREWFGEGGPTTTATAVETAEPVNLARAQAKARKKAPASRPRDSCEKPISRTRSGAITAVEER